MKRLTFVLMMLSGMVGKSFSQERVLKQQLRINPEFKKEEVYEAVKVYTTDTVSFKKWIKQSGSTLRADETGNGIFIVSGLSGTIETEFENFPSTLWIDRSDRKPEEETVGGDFDQTVNSLGTARHIFPEISGHGLVLSVKEKPFDTEDIDLRGRVLLNDQFDEPPTMHATVMATIAAGAGNSVESAKGGGWKAKVTTSDFSSLLPESLIRLKSQDVIVQNHSYGVGPENYYGIESVAYDQQVTEFPQILHVFSAGNRGTFTPVSGTYTGLNGFANLTGQFKVSKNTLTAGSVDRYNRAVPESSRGPAHDGRIKPELVAFGDAGSSESAAVVSGIALMVYDVLKNTTEFTDAALVKSILINSARDIGRPGPDFETGFGNVNALGAVETAVKGNFFSGIIADEGEIVTFPVAIPENSGKLKVTLTWIDPPAEPFAGKALINDLDLEVIHLQSGQKWLPWILDPSPSGVNKIAIRGVDRLNNVEQVSADVYGLQEFQITVKAHSVSTASQKFFISYSYDAGFQWTHPVSSQPLRSGTKNILRWHWNEPPRDGILEVRYLPSQEWTRLSEEIPLDQEFFEWEPTAQQGTVQFRMNAGDQKFLSDITAFNFPEKVLIGYDCSDEILLRWNPTPSAEGYRILGVGEKFLESLILTRDTFAVIDKALLLSGHFSVIPVIAGLNGARESSVFYKSQGTGCYFKSILAETGLVHAAECADVTEGRLLVSLGTTYKLKSLTLERAVAGDFQPLFTSGITTEKFTLVDNHPLKGFNNYRIRLITTEGKEIISDTAGFFAVCGGEPVLFPNPVSANSDLNVVIENDDIAVIRIYDSFGRLLKGTSEPGVIRSFSLDGISAGVYQVIIQGVSGTRSASRLIIK